MSSSKRSALAVTVLTVLSLALLLLSNFLVAARFGASRTLDLYLSAAAVPNFLIALVSGALTSCLLPLLAEQRAQDQKDLGRAVASVLNALALGSLVVCSAVGLLAKGLMAALLPGLSAPETAEAARLLQWLLPTVVLTAISEVFANALYADHRVILPTGLKLLPPVLVIAFLLLLPPRFGIQSVIYATLAATALQTLILLIVTLQSDAAPSAVLDFRPHPLLSKFLGLAVPLVLSMVLYRSLPLFDRWFASRLPEGSITVLSYGRNLFLALQPVLVSGIAVSYYPVMADLAARGDHASLVQTMAKSCRMLLFVSVPLAFYAGLWSEPLVRFLLARGSYTPEAAAETYKVFAIYVFSLPAGLVGTILGQGAYVLKMTRTIAILGVMETAIYMATCLLLKPMLGLYAVPTAFFVYFHLSFAVLAILLSKKLRNSLFLPLAPPLLRALATSALSVAPAWGLSAILPPTWGRSVLQIFLAAAVYAALSLTLLKAEEARLLIQTLAGRFRSPKSLS